MTVDPWVPLAKSIAWKYKSRVPSSHHDDIDSDAMYGLFIASRDWQQEGEFRAWAAMIIHRRIIDGIRRRVRHNVEPLPDEEVLVSYTTEPERVFFGKIELEDRVIEHNIERAMTPPAPPKTDLGIAELEVLSGAANGESAHETADRRGVTTETIKSQRQRVLAKLGATNMTQAVAYAFRRGLLV